jgi:hypothetical protein
MSNTQIKLTFVIKLNTLLKKSLSWAMTFLLKALQLELKQENYEASK